MDVTALLLSAPVSTTTTLRRAAPGSRPRHLTPQPHQNKRIIITAAAAAKRGRGEETGDLAPRQPAMPVGPASSNEEGGEVVVVVVWYI